MSRADLRSVVVARRARRAARAVLGALALLASGCPGPAPESRSLDVLSSRARAVAGFHVSARVVHEDAARPGTVRWEQGYARVEIDGAGDRLFVRIAHHSPGAWSRRTILVRGDEIYAHRASLGGLVRRYHDGDAAPEELDEAFLFVDAHRGYSWLRRIGRARLARAPAGASAALARCVWLELDSRAFPPGSNYDRMQVALDPRDGLPRAVRGGPFPEDASEVGGLMLVRVFTVTSLTMGAPSSDLRLPAAIGRGSWHDLGSGGDVTVPRELIAER